MRKRGDCCSIAELMLDQAVSEARLDLLAEAMQEVGRYFEFAERAEKCALKSDTERRRLRQMYASKGRMAER
jgi:hypothetical protein